jgi:hypothetical protein
MKTLSWKFHTYEMGKHIIYIMQFMEKKCFSPPFFLFLLHNNSDLVIIEAGRKLKKPIIDESSYDFFNIDHSQPYIAGSVRSIILSAN